MTGILDPNHLTRGTSYPRTLSHQILYRSHIFYGVPVQSIVLLHVNSLVHVKAIETGCLDEKSRDK